MPSVGFVVLGGIGNQMFQVAAAYAHAKTHNCTLALKKSKNEKDGRSLYWDNALVAFQPFLVDELPAGLTLWNQPGNGCMTYEKPPAPTGAGLQLKGYFQSSKYFGASKTDLKNLLRPSTEVLEDIKAKYNDLLNFGERVVVVHARRGDYCRDAGTVNFHGPLPIEYYTRTLTDMSKAVANPYFLFVCEEPDFWKEVISSCSEFINDSNSFILNENDEVLTLALLQQFHNFIIANSTFSWWAAWLAPAHRVYAPRNWFGPAGPKEWHDIYESGWTLY